MAVWQFDFFVVSEGAVTAAFDGIPAGISDFLPSDTEADSEVDVPTYLSFQPNSESVVNLLGTIGSEIRSWSDEARMFGASDGDKIELWSDIFLCRVDLRDLNIDFIERVLHVAKSLKCLVVCKESGKVLRPNVPDVCREILESSAAKFVQNPTDFFNSIAARHEDDIPTGTAGRGEGDRKESKHCHWRICISEVSAYI